MTLFKQIFKRKAAIACTSLACVIAIIGAGFSAWYFAGNSASTSASFRVVITEAVMEGGYYTYDDLPAYVVLDGGSRGGVNNTITGIEFYKVGYSGYDTANDQDNYQYDEDGNLVTNVYGDPVVQSGSSTPLEVLNDPSFTITYTYKGAMTAAQAEALTFGLRVEVTGFLQKYITHSTTYYSYSTIDSDSGYYLDLKDFSQRWGSYHMEQSGSGEDTLTVFTFGLTTTLLNTFFAYTYDGITVEEGGDMAVALYQAILADMQNLDGSTASAPKFVIYLLETGTGY